MSIIFAAYSLVMSIAFALEYLTPSSKEACIVAYAAAAIAFMAWGRASK